MKNTQQIFRFLFTLFAISIGAGAFVSCEVGLGNRLDLAGPIVEIEHPVHGQPVNGVFYITGTVESVGSTTVERILVTARFTSETHPGSNEWVTSSYPRQWRFISAWEISDDGGLSWQPLPPVVTDENGSTVTWQPEINISQNRRKVDFTLPIDMRDFIDYRLSQSLPVDGRYLFSVTAWDNMGNSDSRSNITRLIILNTVDPVVNFILPRPFDPFYLNKSGTELYRLHRIADDDIAARRTMANIQRIVTGEPFIVQWQVETPADVWAAIDIRFYRYDTDWKNDYDNYIYRTTINDWNDIPTVFNPDDALNPFYRIEIADFSNPDRWPSDFSERDALPLEQRRRERLSGLITEKTTMRIIVRCIDASHNLLEQDVGMFIYWPAADYPWIEFPENLRPWHTSDITAPADYRLHILFPDSTVPVFAFDNRGVTRVEYSIYLVESNHVSPNYGQIINTLGVPIPNVMEDDRSSPNFGRLVDPVTRVPIPVHGSGYREPSAPRSVFSWSFTMPAPVLSGHYFISVVVSDDNDPPKREFFTGYYEIMDLSFPLLDPPFQPRAAEPLFMFINDTEGGIENWYIEVRGYAFGTMGISDVNMVWVNPASVNAAANSQLAFFRDSNYGAVPKPEFGLGAFEYGWFVAPQNPDDPPGLDRGYDPDHPNLVWNMNLRRAGDEDRHGVRYQRFEYSKRIYLRDLNIGPGMMWTDNLRTQIQQIPPDLTSAQLAQYRDQFMDYLRSQIFVIRARDVSEPHPKSIIITWAPQGDTSPPEVEITEVRISRRNPVGEGYFFPPDENPLSPGKMTEIPAFNPGDRISITGTWREDSYRSSAVRNSYFNDSFRITMNGINIPKTITPAGQGLDHGAWSSTVTVGPEDAQHGEIRPGHLMDTLVINASMVDVGGNPSDHTLSWRVQSDALRLIRIGSNQADGFFNAGRTIDIFLEFNHPVIAQSMTSGTNHPRLSLNTGGEAIFIHDHADHNPGGTGHIRQYFRYTVQQGHNAPFLNVTGISGNALWVSGIDGDQSLLVHTSQAGDARGRLPIVADNVTTGQEYMRTLRAARTFIIDTTPPSNPAITIVPASGNLNEGTPVFITLAFTENSQPDPIMITSTTDAERPRLRLNVRNGAGAYVYTDDVIVSNNRVTFSYTIQPGDYSGDTLNNFSYLRVLGITNGSRITDRAGNSFLANNDFSTTVTSNFTAVRIDTIAPNPPTLRLITEQSPGNWVPVLGGASAGAGAPWNPSVAHSQQNDLGIVFFATLNMEITAGTQLQGKQMPTLNQFEVSFDNGQTWGVRALNAAGQTTISVPLEAGVNQVTARMVDSAGNRSQWTLPVRADWDTGEILLALTTTAPTGSKTRGDEIPIELTFRHPVNISSVSFTMNIGTRPSGDETSPPPSFVREFSVSGADLLNPNITAFSADRRIWTFTYVVRDRDATRLPANAANSLRVTEMGITAHIRQTGGGNGPEISNMVVVNEGSTVNRLHRDKEIHIVTTSPQLVAGYPRFTAGTRVLLDDSYATTLLIRWQEPVSRSAGNIRIEQDIAGFRIPAVLNDTQRARYRSTLNSIARAHGLSIAGLNLVNDADFIFDHFYELGTSGLITRGTPPTLVPDPANKFILRFNYNTHDTSRFNIPSRTPSNAWTDYQKLAWLFWEAERINLSINSSAIEDLADGLRVNLTGFFSLRVIGAQYIVSFDENLVLNTVGNGPVAYDSRTAGHDSRFMSQTSPDVMVAQATIRFDRAEEEIQILAPGPNMPRLHAVQPGQTRFQMDCRTPNSRVAFVSNSISVGNDTSQRWSAAYFDNIPTTPTSAGTPTAGSPTAAVSAAIPNAPTTLAPATHNQQRLIFPRVGANELDPIIIGPPAAANGMYEGYKLHINAAGVLGGVAGSIPATFGPVVQDRALRTVIVFQGVNVAGFYDEALFRGGLPAAPVNNAHGRQLWIRGGNTVFGTTIPGFPLTPADDFQHLHDTNTRAGIRLMSRISSHHNASTSLQTSTWQWVTWDMRATAFFDIFLGYDDVVTDTAVHRNRIFQYGPRFVSRHTGDWSILKQHYAAIPGERRWLTNNSPTFANQTRYTFSPNFTMRGGVDLPPTILRH